MKAEFYVTFKASTDSFIKDRVIGVKAMTMTMSKPENPSGPVVKFVVDVPAALFDPIEVEVTLDATQGVVQALQKTAKDLS